MLTNEQKKRLLETKQIFINRFKFKPTDYFKSSGRLEIIGNHVDYNGGSVINSNAGNLNILASVSKTDDNIINVISSGYPDLRINLNNIEYKKEEEETSVALLKGILTRFKFLGHKIGGYNAVITSNIFKGGGVSSSAAFAVLMCKILSYYYNDDTIDVIERAKISRWSENNFFGKGSGLQDQIGCQAQGFAITDYYHQENPKVEYFHVDLKDYEVMLIDTRTDHAESQNAFQSIVNEMRDIAKYFHVDYLIDIPFDSFMEQYKKNDNNTKRPWRRAYHFLTECKRVENAYKHLKTGDIKSFLTDFNESGLSSEYYLESILPEGVKKNNLQECLHMGREFLKDGAIRVHGGGFGGTCMLFINKNEIEDFMKKMSSKFGRDQFIYLEISDNPICKIDNSEIE